MAEQGDQKQGHEEEEEDLGNTCGSNRDSSKAENGRHQSDDEEDESPAQNIHPSLSNVNLEMTPGRGAAFQEPILGTDQGTAKGLQRGALKRHTAEVVSYRAGIMEKK